MQPGVQRMTSRARAWPRPWAPARLPKGVARLSLVLMAVVLTAGACPAPPIESNDVDRARVDALLASDPGLPATGVRLGGAGVGSRNLRYLRPSVTTVGTLLPMRPAFSTKGLTAEHVLAEDEASAALMMSGLMKDLRKRGWVVTYASCGIISTVGVEMHRSWQVEARRQISTTESGWSLMQVSSFVARRYGSDDLALARVESLQQAWLPFHLDDPNVFAPPSGIPPGGLTATCADAQMLPATEQTEGTAFPPLVDGPPR